jgi:hypothetical protein
MSEGLRAILAMYAFQVGGGCESDDELGVKCTLTRALKLGAQCSDQQLALVHSWFKGGMPKLGWHSAAQLTAALQSNQLRDLCYDQPYTASHQNMWTNIVVTHIGSYVRVNASAETLVSSDDPGYHQRFVTEYRIGRDAVTVISHRQSK